MTKKIIYIVSILFCLAGNAQVPISEISADTKIFPMEKVSLINNSNLLLAGELLDYKAFVQNASNKESTLSKIVYVSMRNNNDSVVFSHKLKVANGMANGDFFIPATLKTGIYNLIGYTNFSRNNEKNAFAQKTVYVINTFQKSPLIGKSSDSIEIKGVSEKELDQKTGEINSSAIKITSDKVSYGTREKVTLNLAKEIGAKNGDFVVSVRKIDPISISKKIVTAEMVQDKGNFYLPEIRGEIISGTVKTKNGNNPAANKIVALTIPGKGNIFKLSKTNENGRFYFSISEPYEAENGIIQINEPNKEIYTLSMDKKEVQIQEMNDASIKLDSSLVDWLQERSVQMQVDNAYFAIKKDSILGKKPAEPFFDNLGMNYVLDDYTRFPTVRETFVEVIQTAAIRNEGNKYRFLVYNEYNPNGSAKFNSIDPLVLVDGVLLQNNEDLLNYNANNIWSVRVVAEPYRYGPKVYSGLIAVTTKKDDFVPTLEEGTVQKFKIEPIVRDKEYYRPDYSEKQTLSRIPDYRVQLFWMPNVSLKDENFSTSFYTSDVTGLFEITVAGYTDDGNYISAKNYFRVENK